MRLFIFADEETALAIKNSAEKKYRGVEVVCRNFDAEEAEKNAAEGDCAFLIDYTIGEKNELDGFILSLTGKKIKFAVICKGVQEGFLLMSRGAADMAVKPSGDGKNINSLVASVVPKLQKILSAGESRSKLKLPNTRSFNHVIAIGSSTGGTEAVFSIIKELPADCPPVLLVQHMPPVFTRFYAERLYNNTKLTVWEANDGDMLQRGLCLVAPGGKNMSVFKKDGEFYIALSDDDRSSLHCPSVDFLFNSVGAVLKERGVGIILTGMGSDGANGLLKMRKAGAYTIGQDEESCVVYGMPKVALEIGAVIKQSCLKDIAAQIMRFVD